MKTPLVYGDKRDYPKIDIFVAHYDSQGNRYRTYTASTTWAKTCKDAAFRYWEAQQGRTARDDITCSFAS